MKQYIERDAFLERTYEIFCKDCDSYRGILCGSCFIDDMKNEIVDYPAADVVERVRGEWVDNHNGTFTCTACGGKSSKMDYCGRCGADMRGEA